LLRKERTEIKEDRGGRPKGVFINSRCFTAAHAQRVKKLARKKGLPGGRFFRGEKGA